MVDFDKLAAEIQSGEKRISELIILSDLKLPDGTTIEKVEIEHGTSEEESKTAREFLNLNAQNNNIGDTVNNLSPLLSQKSLNTVCDEYFQEKLDSTQPLCTISA